MITGNGTGVGGVVNDGSCYEEDRNCLDSDEPSARTQLCSSHTEMNIALILVLHFWVPNNATHGRIPKRLKQHSLAEPPPVECGHKESFLISS